MPTRTQLHRSWKFQMNFFGVLNKQSSSEPVEKFSGKKIGEIVYGSKEKKIEIVPDNRKKGED